MSRLEGWKKIIVAVIASGIAFLGIREGYTEAQVLLVIGPLTGYLLSQGMADFGKEAKKVSGS